MGTHEVGSRPGCWRGLGWCLMGAAFPALAMLAALGDLPALAVVSSVVALVWAGMSCHWAFLRSRRAPVLGETGWLLGLLYLMYAFIAGLWLQFPALHETVLSRGDPITLDFGAARHSPLLEVGRAVGQVAFVVATAGPAVAAGAGHLLGRAGHAATGGTRDRARRAS